MNEQGASDLHLVSGSQPILGVHGDMERIKYKALDNEDFSPDKKIIFQGSADHFFLMMMNNRSSQWYEIFV